MFKKIDTNMRKPTKIFISSNENPEYIQFWPLVASAWNHLGFDPVLALVTSQPESRWSWMRDFGEVVRFAEHDEMPSGNWAKMARWWLYSKYENEIGIVSDMDMIPLQRGYFEALPKEYNPETHLLIKGTYDMNPQGKFPGCYMTATGKVWKEILKPEKYESPHEWVKQFYDRARHDEKEAVNSAYDVFSEESLMRSVVLEWDPSGDRTIRLDRPGGWQHGGVKSTSLRVDRSAWPGSERGWEEMGFSRSKSYPNDLAKPTHYEGGEFYIDAHCPRPLQKYSHLIERLAKYVGVDKNLMAYGVIAANETFGK